jgi:hypothetical protein
LPSPEGLRTDQLLTSEFFGLNSTMDPEIDELFTEYYFLLSKRERTVSEDSRIKDIKKQLKDLRYMGTGKRERLMYEAIDEYLANSKHLSINELKNRAIKQQAFQKITEIWQRSNVRDEDD